MFNESGGEILDEIRDVKRSNVHESYSCTMIGLASADNEAGRQDLTP